MLVTVIVDIQRTPKEKAAVKRPVSSVVYEYELFVRELKACSTFAVFVAIHDGVSLRSEHFCTVVIPQDNGVLVTNAVSNVKDNVTIGIDTTDSTAVLTLRVATIGDIPTCTSFSSRYSAYCTSNGSN